MLDRPVIRMSTAIMRPKVSEQMTHEAIIQLLKLTAVDGCVYYHPANGESRSARTGAKLKKMGVRAGVADIALVLPDGRAAFLEVKAPAGRLSPVQREFADALSLSRAPYAVVRSMDEARSILKQWGAVK